MKRIAHQTVVNSNNYIKKWNYLATSSSVQCLSALSKLPPDQALPSSQLQQKNHPCQSMQHSTNFLVVSKIPWSKIQMKKSKNLQWNKNRRLLFEQNILATCADFWSNEMVQKEKDALFTWKWMHTNAIQTNLNSFHCSEFV